MAGIGCGEEEGSLALINFTPVTSAGFGPGTSGELLLLLVPGLALSSVTGSFDFPESPGLKTALTGDTDTHISGTE